MNNKFYRIILKRLGHSLLVLLIVTLLVFFIMKSVPGDPVRIFLGATATQEQIDHYTKLFGYDKPAIVQYGMWVINLFKGEMGRSVIMGQDISKFIFERFAVTLSVVLPAFILAVLIGTTLGVIAALKRGKWIDSLVSTFANLGVSMPIFWLGIILILIFSIRLGLLPVQGYVPPWVNFAKSLRGLIIPVIVCSLAPLAQFTRQTRSAMLEVLRQDYVRTAKAKGLDMKDVIIKHQLRNALIPIITVMGVTLGVMVGTTIVIESLFVIPGLGNLMITAIRSKDFMVVQNVVFLLSAFIILCNLLVDLLYGVIDPRIRGNK